MNIKFLLDKIEYYFVYEDLDLCKSCKYKNVNCYTHEERVNHCLEQIKKCLLRHKKLYSTENILNKTEISYERFKILRCRAEFADVEPIFIKRKRYYLWLTEKHLEMLQNCK